MREAGPGRGSRGAELSLCWSLAQAWSYRVSEHTLHHCIWLTWKKGASFPDPGTVSYWLRAVPIKGEGQTLW